jgi:glucose-1-phosphate thymidylyltransferase
MKGIVLAGGTGSRLYPLTLSVCKQLLPVYDKPLVYYPVSTLLLAGLKEILLISTPEDRSLFERLLGDGSHLGISISYAVQPEPRGIAESLLIGRQFVGTDAVALILGDNIVYGRGLPEILQRVVAAEGNQRATVFGYAVRDPRRYGVVTFAPGGRVLSIDEKPSAPRSNYAVVGLYFFPNDAAEVAAQLAPSARGELEITDVSSWYLAQGRLDVQLLGRGFAWFDAGTHASMHDASGFVRTIEERTGLSIACPEEIALHMGHINEAQLADLADRCGPSDYGRYLRSIVEEARSMPREED